MGDIVSFVLDANRLIDDCLGLSILLCSLSGIVGAS
jgi:hypothetical protein